MVGPESFENALYNSCLIYPSLSGFLSFPLELQSLQPTTLQSLEKAVNSLLSCPVTSWLKSKLFAMCRCSAAASFWPHLTHTQSRNCSVNIRSATNRAADCLEQKIFFSFFSLCTQYCKDRTTSDFIPARAEHTHKLLSDTLPSYNFPSYIFLLCSIPFLYW